MYLSKSQRQAEIQVTAPQAVHSAVCDLPPLVRIGDDDLIAVIRTGKARIDKAKQEPRFNKLYECKDVPFGFGSYEPEYTEFDIINVLIKEGELPQGWYALNALADTRFEWCSQTRQTKYNIIYDPVENQYHLKDSKKARDILTPKKKSLKGINPKAPTTKPLVTATLEKVLLIDDDELTKIITKAEGLIKSYSHAYPKLNEHAIINLLLKRHLIDKRFIRLRILNGCRSGKIKNPDVFEKWGIGIIDKGAWVEYHLFKEWTKPKATKGKFLTAENNGQNSSNDDNNNEPSADEIRALTAFCYYTHLRTINPDFKPSKLNDSMALDHLKASEVLANFDKYLSLENQTVTNLTDSNLDTYIKSCDYMKSKSPQNHRTKICRMGDTKFYYNKQTKKNTLINEQNCENPFCMWCNNGIGSFNENLAGQVDEKNLALGRQSLQLTLAPPPHTKFNKLSDVKPLMQLSYKAFNRKAMIQIKKLGYHGKLKRFDPVYSITNGHHPHIHVAYSIDDITDEQLAELQAMFYNLWLDCMITEKLLLKKDRKAVLDKGMACDIRINPHAFQYVARKHKSRFTIMDLPAIALKSKTKCLSMFELSFLAEHGMIADSLFTRVYGEVLTEFYETTILKYSANYLSTLGLKNYVHKANHKPPVEPMPLSAPTNKSKPKKAVSEPLCDNEGQYLNDNDQYLLFDTIDTMKTRKQRADKGKPRKPKPPPPMQATTKHDEQGQDVLIKGYKPDYPTMPKTKPSHLVHLSTLNYEQMTALTNAKAVGLYSGMLEHAYKKGYFVNDIPFS